MTDQAIATHICVQARKPVFLWGGPGIGKTTALEAISEALNEPLHTVILSVREPSDQSGLPFIVDGAVKLVPPGWAKSLIETGHGIVFWDEMNTAAPTTQSSALRVVQGGYAGDAKLPDATSHVAAGNPATMVAGGYDLTAATANRWVHIDWPVDPTEWSTGMVRGWPKPVIHRIAPTWQESVPAKRGLVSSFIRRRPNLLYSLPKSPSEQGRAWPSPRTWESVATLMAAASGIGHNEKSTVGRILIHGCVGEAAGSEFIKWFTELDLRDPEEYLADPIKTPVPQRQDQLMATIDSVAAAALDRSKPIKDQVERYRAAWKLMGRVFRSGKGDVTIPSARVLAVAIPKECKRDLPPEIEEILPLLEAAGIDFSQH